MYRTGGELPEFGHRPAVGDDSGFRQCISTHPTRGRTATPATRFVRRQAQLRTPHNEVDQSAQRVLPPTARRAHSRKLHRYQLHVRQHGLVVAGGCGDAGDESAVFFVPNPRQQHLARETTPANRAHTCLRGSRAVHKCVDARLAHHVGAQAVQDRPRKARCRGEFGIGVQRITVPA